MQKLDWRWILGIALVAILLYNVSPQSTLIPSEALLNVEIGKAAAIAFQLQASPVDADQTDGNYSLHECNYKITSANGTLLQTGTASQIDTVCSISVSYAPTKNSTVTAEITEKQYTISNNASTLVSTKIVASQSIDVNAVPAQSSTVITNTSTGYSTPATVTPANSTLPTLDILVPAPETFWDKYGLFVMLTVSIIIFGLALLNYFQKGKRRR